MPSNAYHGFWSETAITLSDREKEVLHWFPLGNQFLGRKIVAMNYGCHANGGWHP